MRLDSAAPMGLPVLLLASVFCLLMVAFSLIGAEGVSAEAGTGRHRLVIGPAAFTRDLMGPIWA